MNAGWCLALLLIIPAFGLAAWMWLAVSEFNLDGLALPDMQLIPVED